MSKLPGKVIMFDGPDGAGKTTQFELAAATLRQKGYTVFTTHMLGGTPIGKALREVMFSDTQRPALTNLHLSLSIYFALAEEVELKRQQGIIVLIDRSPLSLIAYQVYGDGVNEKLGFAACDESLAAFQPDAILVYDAPLAILEARRQNRQKDVDYFEKQSSDYHAHTARGYEAACERYHATRIDANRDVPTVHAETMQIIETLL